LNGICPGGVRYGDPTVCRSCDFVHLEHPAGRRLARHSLLPHPWLE